MKILSLKNPFASLVTDGLKTIETRWWKTYYRGPLLIASTKQEFTKQDLFELYRNKKLYREVYNYHQNNLRNNGVALCVCNLIDVRPMEKNDVTNAYVEYHPDRFSWVLDDIQEISPFMIKGQQGLFNADNNILSKLQDALAINVT